jgi:hypothetical protein
MIQTITKSIRISFSRGILNFDPPLMEIDFSLQQGVTGSLLAKFHQQSKFPRFSSEFSSEFQLIVVL